MNKNFETSNMVKAQSCIKEILELVEEVAGYIADDANVEEYFREVYPEEMSDDNYEGAVLAEVGRYLNV